MSAKGTFQFRNYTLRKAGAIATDLLLAKQWTEADPDHAGKVDPEFWIEQDFDRDSYLLLDSEGALFFWKGIVRIDDLLVEKRRIIEMHIQFPPTPPDPAEARALRVRISVGLVEGLRWLEAVLRQVNVKEIYFDSENPALTRFCQKQLSFVSDGQRLYKQLTTPSGGPEASGKENISLCVDQQGHRTKSKPSNSRPTKTPTPC